MVQDEPERDSSVVIVRKAMDDLPKSMREVLILRYYDDRSYEQISAVLGLSKSAINGLLTRAKRKLAKSLRRTRRAGGYVMNAEHYDERLDDLLHAAIGGHRPSFDFQRWKQNTGSTSMFFGHK